MTCDGIRESAHEYLKEWLEPREAQVVRQHLEKCTDCSADLEVTRSRLTLLQNLLELAPDPETWTRIEARLPRRATPSFAHRLFGSAGATEGKRVFRFSLQMAAAASILVAAASFILLAAMNRSRALPVVAETHKALNWNEPFTAAAFTLIEIPDVGTLKLNQNTTLRLTDSRTCLLEKGEVFAEIVPSGRGFEIRSADTTVIVHGTKFGVTAPGAVYVVEGRVEVRSPRGRVELTPGRAVNAALVEISAEDSLRWLARHERPNVRLALDPLDKTTVTPGAPLTWNLKLETDALAPLYLGKPRDLSQFFSLVINESTVLPLDAAGVALKAGTSAPNGLVRLDVSHSCVLECAVDPALFREKGPVTVRAVYNSGAQAPEGAWVGTVRSSAVRVEVK